jgi:hypothetical protein|nr:MAG TPA: protein of unknown function (DUF370) [Caudoviricetes sp.]
MLVNDMFLDLGFGYKVAMKEIFAIMPMDVSSSKELFRRYFRDGKVLRATKGRKAHSYLLLNNGMVFASAYTTDELTERVWELKRIARAIDYAEV